MKHKIRKKILTARENHDDNERGKKDSSIEKKMFSLPEFRKAKIVLFYVSIRGEVRTDNMISEALDRSKRILVVAPSPPYR